METAFISCTPLGVSSQFTARSVTRLPSTASLRTSGGASPASSRCFQMCDEKLSPAEQTRRALADSEPLVKFRRQTQYLDEEDPAFRYTSGTTQGGFDVWLVAAILTVVVPAVGFAIGVATGNIEINPR